MSNHKPSFRILRHGIFAAAVVTVMTLPSSSRAADLDAGYADVPPPIPQQNVAFGSGWYIRGDIAALETYKVDTLQPTTIKRSNDVGFDASLGGGYAFNNGFRTDITGDFFQPTQVCLGVFCKRIGQFQRYQGLANAYYDFGPWSIFTPYVGAGVGASFGSKTISDTREKYSNLAWALMAGVAVDVYSHVKLDIGYRYLNSGQVFGRTLYDHQIRAGIRYMIDN